MPGVVHPDEGACQAIATRLSTLQDLRLPAALLREQPAPDAPQVQHHLHELLRRDAAVFLEVRSCRRTMVHCCAVSTSRHPRQHSARACMHCCPQRYGPLLLPDELASFEPLRGSYEVDHYLKAAAQQQTQQAQQQGPGQLGSTAKNRRLAYMRRLQQDEGGYFSEAVMRQRQPLVWQEHIGQHEGHAAAPAGPPPGVRVLCVGVGVGVGVPVVGTRTTQVVVPWGCRCCTGRREAEALPPCTPCTLRQRLCSDACCGAGGRGFAGSLLESYDEASFRARLQQQMEEERAAASEHDSDSDSSSSSRDEDGGDDDHDGSDAVRQVAAARSAQRAAAAAAAAASPTVIKRAGAAGSQRAAQGGLQQQPAAGAIQAAAAAAEAGAMHAHAAADMSAAAMARRRQQFLADMQSRFLLGLDAEQHDYAAIDADATLDDDLAAQQAQDAQDAYFDAD
jgi:hypothetical protein